MESMTNKGWIYTDRVSGEAAGETVLDFYATRYRHSTREQWSARLAAGQIRLEGRIAVAGEVLAPGQNLAYHRAAWCEPGAPAEAGILHVDDDLIAVAKPSGLPVLPGGGYLENTLLAVVRRRFGDNPAPVHRLGRATSGVVLFARSAVARRELSGQLAQGRLGKRYLALVAGDQMPDRFDVTTPIGPVPYEPLGRVHAASETGKASISRVRVVERRPAGPSQPGSPEPASLAPASLAPCSLVEVEIPTGRPHQIRIHLAAAGHPLIGDPLYGVGGQPNQPEEGQRPALPGDGGYHLHAASATFTHPADLRQMTVYCQPPAVLCPVANRRP